MTAVTVVESDSSYIHGNFGLHLARVLVAASGDTYTTPFSDIANIQATLETAQTNNTTSLCRASESSAGVITFGINGTNAVVSLAIWGKL